MIKTPDNENLIMEMTLIINSFFEIGFLPQSLEESIFDFEPETQLKDISLCKLQRSAPVKPTKLLVTNGLLNELRNIEKFERSRGRNKCFNNNENLFETKKLLEKEQLLKLNRLVHYWDFISIVFGELDTCRFAAFNYKDAECCSQKAIGWILLTLKQRTMLSEIFKVLYTIDHIEKSLYDPIQSYFVNFRENILEITKLLETIPLNFEMKITRDFEAYHTEVKNNKILMNSNISKQFVVDFEEGLQIEDGTAEKLVQISTTKESEEDKTEEVKSEESKEELKEQASTEDEQLHCDNHSLVDQDINEE